MSCILVMVTQKHNGINWRTCSVSSWPCSAVVSRFSKEFLYQVWNRFRNTKIKIIIWLLSPYPHARYNTEMCDKLKTYSRIHKRDIQLWPIWPQWKTCLTYYFIATLQTMAATQQSPVGVDTSLRLQSNRSVFNRFQLDCKNNHDNKMDSTSRQVSLASTRNSPNHLTKQCR